MKNHNKIGEKINKKKFHRPVEDEELISKLSWKKLYLKFYLEEYCKFFPYAPVPSDKDKPKAEERHSILNFKELYRLLDLFKGDIEHFVLYISDSGLLKSDYNYLRVIISKLTSLKYIELIFANDELWDHFQTYVRQSGPYRGAAGRCARYPLSGCGGRNWYRSV